MNPSTTAPEQSTNSGDGSASRLNGRDLRVEQRAVEALIPYARNARTHSDKQVAEIAGSIKAFGWTNPILVDGENGVIAGHGRLLAARKLKLASVPVIELAGLSEAEKRAYILADNKLALNAGWSDDLLAAEVADLDALGFNLSLAGFGESEVGKLIDLFQKGSAPSFPDEAPDPPDVPISREGDLWLLGEHRLLCGDAQKPEDLSRVLGGGLADMVFTDPPYANEPRPAHSIPTCPAHLNASAKAEWKRLCQEMHRLRIISQLDRAAMAAYCQAYGRWVEAERAMKDSPTLIRLPSGYIQPSPWLGIANKQLELMHKYMSDLGLSPVSRARVAKLPSIGPKPWETPRACDKYLRPQWGNEPEPVDEFFGD